MLSVPPPTGSAPAPTPEPAPSPEPDPEPELAPEAEPAAESAPALSSEQQSIADGGADPAAPGASLAEDVRQKQEETAAAAAMP